LFVRVVHDGPPKNSHTAQKGEKPALFGAAPGILRWSFICIFATAKEYTRDFKTNFFTKIKPPL
jgi:hypothetical protein